LLTPAITPVKAGTKEYDKSLFGDRQSWRDFASRPPSPEELTFWRAAGANFGVVMGEASGIWGLDDDGGLPDLEYPPTPTSRSSRGVTRFFNHDRPIATVHADGFCILASGHADGRT
jgi:hypothetical protein